MPDTGSDVAVAFGDVAPLGHETPDPHERARSRLERLTTSFAETLAIVAQMYRDEDWRYLQRPDGTPYASLAEVFSDAMSMSMSMARRYIQGARDFYLPLSEVMVDGTRIEVTSGDIAELGASGLSDVVESVKPQLEDSDDPEEATQAITEAIGDAKDRKRSPSSSDEFDDPHSDASDFTDGATVSHGGHALSGVDALPDPFADDSNSAVATSDHTDPANAVLDEEDLDDPLDKVLSGATSYDDPEALAALSEPLRSVVDALVKLARMDPTEVSQVVTYDTRGALLPIDGAMTNITRFRALSETHPWLLARLTD